jgi:UDP-GlcNAc3NAcA epimerase
MIVHIVGARPQFIKLLPLHEALARRGAPQRVIHSGQHWEAGMSEVFFQEFGLQPDTILAWSQEHEENIGAMAEALKQWQPDTVVVYGDTFSTWCAARAAKRLGLPLAHVEAGLRSFNAAMPEEEARVKTDTVSDWHFVPSERALVQLQREGLDRGEAHTLMTGDIMADALLNRPMGSPKKGRILVTLHRNTNVDDPVVRARIVQALEGLAKSHEIHWPIHPRLRAHLEQGTMPKHIHWYPPLGREAILEQLDAAEWVITDSGGLQKEAYFCRRKCIVLRNETEWVELVETGQSFLVNPEAARNATHLGDRLLECMQRLTSEEFPPVYGEGDAAAQMAAALWKDGPVKPNTLSLFGDPKNPQLRFAAEVVRRVTGIRVDFSEQGVAWPQASCWSQPFEAWNASDLGEDSLAKAAYVASRAEEFSGGSKDSHGRYVPEASCLWPEMRVSPEVPMGHVWLEQFVKEFRPDFSLASRRIPAPTVVVDIDHRFAFAGYSTMHRWTVALKHALSGNWALLKAQWGAADPFDASQVFEGLMRTYGKVRWQFFAWIGPERGPQDKGPSIRHAFVSKAHAQWAKKYPSTGLHPTYAHHAKGQAGLDTEVQAWTQATSRILQRSRYHYLRMELPISQMQLVKAGCLEDWSMEYAKQPGYRAGVAVPIPAWGLGPEGEALDADGIPFLTYVPVALMDQNLLGESAETIHATLTKWQAAARKCGAGLVLGTHWRFFGQGSDSFAETRAYRPWVQGLQAFLRQQNA